MIILMTLRRIATVNASLTQVYVTNSTKLPLQRTRHGHSAGVAYELRVAAAVPTVGTRGHRASQNIPSPRSSSVFASGCVRIQSACPSGLPFLFNCHYPEFEFTAQSTPKDDVIMRLLLGVKLRYAKFSTTLGSCLSNIYTVRQILDDRINY